MKTIATTQKIEDEKIQRRSVAKPEPASTDHTCLNCKGPCDCGTPKDCYFCAACWRKP